MSIVKIRAAIENAIKGMPGIIPAVAIASSTSGTTTVFTTSVPHLLQTGLSVEIANHTTVTGDFNVTVIDSTHFSLKDSVTGAAVSTLANGTGGTVQANLIAWENMNFKVPPGIPFQRANLLPARPVNDTMGSGHYREIGLYQVTLMYPMMQGPGAASARAELIRSTFPRGASFTYSGVTVMIDKTPEILPSIIEDEMYRLPVRIYYWAEIFN